MTEPFPDRLTNVDLDRFRAELKAASAVRHALLALNAPWWWRVLAILPNPKKPLEDWIATNRKRLECAQSSHLTGPSLSRSVNSTGRRLLTLMSQTMKAKWLLVMAALKLKQ